jgi:L-histidine Nalpha-methyltransferase
MPQPCQQPQLNRPAQARQALHAVPPPPTDPTDPTDPTAAISSALMRPQASISPKYFYDAQGSLLFEAITRLPEYYPTRTERAVMARHGAAMAQALGKVDSVIELGAGNCEKAQALCLQLRPRHLVAVDISGEFLHTCAQSLQTALPNMAVHAVVADITQPFSLPPDLPRQRRLVFYPGSSLGNFDPAEAGALLHKARQLIDDDGGLLIGIDLIKDRQVLHAAYDDAAGVTAAFNLNALQHLNRLIGSNFHLPAWRHHAFFNESHSRIEMHLVARSAQQVRWAGGTRSFEAGESIHTENSYKFELPAFAGLLQRSGFTRHQAWTDPQHWFAVVAAWP